MSKLDNIGSMSAQEIFDCIRNGEFTFEEAQDTGEFANTKQREVRELQKNYKSPEDTDWESAKLSNSSDKFIAFKQKYPNSAHNAEVDKYIDDLEWNSATEANSVESYMHYLESCEVGEHRDEARTKIDRLQSSSEEDNDWNNVNKLSNEELSAFLEKYPDSEYVDEINRLMVENSRRPSFEKLKDTIATKVLGHSGVKAAIKMYIESGGDIKVFLSELSKNKNFVHSSVLNGLISDGWLKHSDIVRIFGSAFYNIFQNDQSQKDIPPATPIKSIGDGSEGTTEVYFWGLPSSGKTCVVGALLKYISSNASDYIPELVSSCQGRTYHDILIEIFSDSTIILPGSTPVDCAYEISFQMKERGKNKKHPVTFIDLPGELFKAIYAQENGMPLDSSQTKALRILEDVMITNKTPNQKIHFFVLEYGGANKKIPFGENTYILPPQIYDSVASYFKDKGIFKDKTNAIYFVISKADLCQGADDDERNSKLQEFVTKNYGTFRDRLNVICSENGINEAEQGKVKSLPFWLGDIVLQKYCLSLDEERPKAIFDKVLLNAKGFRGGCLSRFFNLFKG